MEVSQKNLKNTLGNEADIKDAALVSGSADNTAKIWKTNAKGKVNRCTFC